MKTTFKIDVHCHDCAHSWTETFELEEGETRKQPTCPKCQSKKVSYEMKSWVEDQKYEEINHPNHYNSHPSGIECIDVIEHMSFPIGNVIKHLWRAGLKPGMDHHKDLLKAHWYLTRELQRIENEARGTDEGVAISQEMQDKGILELYKPKPEVAL